MAMQTRVAAVGLIAAVLAASPRLGLAQGAAFCLKTPSGAVNCSYQTMILCEQAKQPNSRDQCVPRFETDGTTGSSAAPLGSPRPPGTAPATTHPSLSR
jgi:hypothetical protein